MNASGCEGSVTFKVIVDDPDHPFVEPDTSKQDSTGDSSSVALPDFGTCRYEAFRSGEPLQVFDMQGRFLGTLPAGSWQAENIAASVRQHFSSRRERS